jgi:hypothetical protein
MLKHFAAATLGFAVLFGAIGPAAAGKLRHHWNDQYNSPYAYSYSDRSANYAKRKSQSQPNIKLDFETEAVWRNLRPEWFD